MFLINRIRLLVTTTRHELEPVEPQDETDAGYLWAEREETVEFDLNPDQQIMIDPDSIDRPAR